MSRSIFITALFLIEVLAPRCAREVNIDLPEEPSKIVVVGKFTTNDSFRVRVTLTQPVYQPGELQAPASATVTVAKKANYTRGCFARSRRKVFIGKAKKR